MASEPLRLGETLPESREEGRETEEGPSDIDETLPESREDARDTEAGPSDIEPGFLRPPATGAVAPEAADPAEDLERDRGGRIAGGGKGGGSNGKTKGTSPPGTFEPRECWSLSGSTGENVTDFFELLEPREDLLRSVDTLS